MSNPSRRSSSRHPSRSPAPFEPPPPDLTYSTPVPESTRGFGQDPFHQSYAQQGEQFQTSDFEALQSRQTYLQPDYLPRNPSPHSLSSNVEGSVQSELYFPGSNLDQGEMMSHRDMGYGFMPSPVPSYSTGQSYGSTLAPMPGYYQDAHRNLAGSSGPHYLPQLGGYRVSQSDERDQMQRRRRRNSTERRRQVKLQMRKDRLPSIMGMGLEESPVSSSPVDLFTAAPPVQQQSYVSDSLNRSFSRPSMSPLRDDYRQSGQHGYMSQQPQQSYQPAYTMASMNPSMPTLAPPILSTSNPSFPGGRSSPLVVQTPLPPATISVSPHPEPVVVDQRRDKPQCWDHGCNGREFSTFSNLLRHQREKSGSAAKAYCPRCGAEFTRTTARNGHMEHGKCKSRRPSSETNASTGTNPQR